MLEYNQTVQDHFQRPRNPAPGPCRNSVCGQGGDAATGVWVEFQLGLDGARIERARFRAYGCPHTIALASWLTEDLRGEVLSRDLKLDVERIRAELGLPVEKTRSILMAEDALRACAAEAGL